MGNIAEDIAGIRGRIAAAAGRAGRDPGTVCLVGASAAYKGVTVDQMCAALDAGVSDFGENRVQEAEQHRAGLGERAREASWHFIGHLQTNKAASALSLFDILESVDSLRLARQLSQRAMKPIRILLEVNVAQETSKFGFAPAEVGPAAGEIARLPNLDLAGLMTVAPASPDAELVRPVFRQLHDLATANGLLELSMGMSGDFEVAVEEGATIVRLGRAIFGEHTP